MIKMGDARLLREDEKYGEEVCYAFLSVLLIVRVRR